MEALGYLRKAGCDSGLVLGGLEYLDFLPGIEGLEGSDGVPTDLNVPLLFEVVAASSTLAILVAASKRRSRRIASSISF